MAGRVSPGNLHFLFREERGTVDRRTWALGTAALALALILVALAAYFAGDAGGLAKIGVTSLFIIATMLIAACYYFLSAKRFADRGRAPVLALALPTAAFVAALLSFMQPAGGGTFPTWLAVVADGAFGAVMVWNIVELGCMAGRR